MQVTRIAHSKNLPQSDYASLINCAKRLGAVRNQTWQEFCSMKGVALEFNPELCRDLWMCRRDGIGSFLETDTRLHPYLSVDGAKFTLLDGIPDRLWKAAQRDVLGDISAYYEACLEKLKDKVEANITDEAEKANAYWHLSIGKWHCHSKLHRWMRNIFKHGHTQVANQIVLDSGCYNWVQSKKSGVLEAQGMERGNRVCIPLGTSRQIEGTIRLILVHNAVEIHYTVEQDEDKSDHGSGVLGLDKGYTEVFTDSKGCKLGDGLGKLLTAESDYRKVKGQRRNKLRAVANQARLQGSIAKAERIEQNNLGTQKWDNRKKRHTQTVKTIIYRAVHQACNKAAHIITEDLSASIKGKNYGKNANRRLSGWVKGLIAEAVDSVTKRRGVTHGLTNCAYTSQEHHTCGCLGRRMADVFYCGVCGVVEDADGNAARTIELRPYDPEIRRWDKYTDVRAVLLNRTAKKLGLLNSDSRSVKGELTRSWRQFVTTSQQSESELPSRSKSEIYVQLSFQL